ncbi:MAG: helix-turn-helix domain-containing protein, partial [Elusimicrobiota bacterium]|nr:helix-turn-helix domain-containing protein [Elusimicrobiota bacterium]
MEEIGKLLRETRVSKNISLEEVCNELRIQEKYIVAIENGDRDAFVAEVYCRTFMRSYATFLGLNAEEILKKYTESVGGDTKKNRPRLIDIPDAYRDNRSFFVKERKFFRRIGNN